MMTGHFPLDVFQTLRTPFYYYDVQLLNETLREINATKGNFDVHYALKANANPKLLDIIAKAGLGADCVSGGEIQAARKAGIPPEKIVYAGVGKTDWEIELALNEHIFCFNAESIPELQVIDELARKHNQSARVCLRINPNVDAHTHHYITTGLNENKFGINLSELPEVIGVLKGLSNIELIGLHFHIGSQITDMDVFKNLSIKINEIQQSFSILHPPFSIINCGGGLGINYEHPNHIPMANFKTYFDTFRKHLQLREGQNVHFELGRSVVAPCGSLITRVLYVKKGVQKQFAIVDAGMSDLLRPALYQAQHRIENLTSNEPEEIYDVVGPICESSDVFSTEYQMNQARRGDIIALRSAGAYGEAMASTYNQRELPRAIYSE
ncbi:MAG: diaminopimelate decarboxylase [Bacteroidales bacterium]|jgi:diaminopimelate decarboxylase|nr:diaminopimelate decarboxylase [Bacteroidales bacterium]